MRMHFTSNFRMGENVVLVIFTIGMVVDARHSSSAGLLMMEIREKMPKLVCNRLDSLLFIFTLYKCVKEKSISECTTHQTLRQMDYNSRTSHGVSCFQPKAGI